MSHVSYVPYATVPAANALSSTGTKPSSSPFSPVDGAASATDASRATTTANFLSFSFLSFSNSSNFLLVSSSFLSSFRFPAPSSFSSASFSFLKFSNALKISSLFFRGIFRNSSNAKSDSSFPAATFGDVAFPAIASLFLSSLLSFSTTFARCSHRSSHPDFSSFSSALTLCASPSRRTNNRFSLNSLWCRCHFAMVSAGMTGFFSARTTGISTSRRRRKSTNAQRKLPRERKKSKTRIATTRTRTKPRNARSVLAHHLSRF